MQTSCGSPCYAAPELVISEGLYVGSAVDIWSCGVILYAMLAGYLPFDDDPANPDGDNINLLYKYIVSTPLSFPEYISADARDLLSMMLVPDPTRRANLDGVMRHRWLSAHAGTPRTDGSPNAFGKNVDELERAALDQHQQRRLAYQRQMRAAAMAQNTNTTRSPHGREATHPGVPSRSRSTQPEYLYESSADQSLIQSTSTKNTGPSTPNGSVAGKKPAYGSPSAHGITSDDPFAPPPGQASASLGAAAAATAAAPSRISEEKAPANGATSQSPNNKGHKQNNSGGAGGFRHTIQVEYDEPRTSSRRSDERRGRSSTDHTNAGNTATVQQPPAQVQQQAAKDRRVSDKSSKPLPVSPAPPTPTPVSPAKTPATPTPPSKSSQTRTAAPLPSVPQPQSQIPTPTLNVSKPATRDTTDTTKDKDQLRDKDKDKESSSTASAKSSISKKTGQGHKKGRSSVDKFAFGKIFGSGGNNVTGAPASPIVDSTTTPVTSTIPSGSAASASAASLLTASPEKVGEKEKDEKKDEKRKGRRNTLTVMVEPISRTIRGRSTKSKTATLPVEQSNVSAASLAPPLPSTPTPSSTNNSSKAPQSAIGNASAGSFVLDGGSGGEGTTESGPGGSSNPASSSKAKKVMAWFRTKSKGRDSMGIMQSGGHSRSGEMDDEQVQVVGNVGGPALTLTTPTSTTTKIPQSRIPPRTPAAAAPGHPKRSASTNTESSVMTFSTPNFVQKFRNSVTVGGSASAKHSSSSQQPSQAKQQKLPHEKLRIHHGAVDQTTITTRPPAEVMKHVREILEGMGVEIMLESEYKYRCVRQKKRKGVVGVQPTQIGPGGVNGSPVTPGGSSVNGQKEGDVAAFTMLGSAASNGVSFFILFRVGTLVY